MDHAEPPPPQTRSVGVAWLGHSTIDIRLGSARLLTDPVLRNRLGHLVRHGGSADLDRDPGTRSVDVVLISHLHHDHLDLPSLRALPPGTPIVVPRGAARLVARAAPGEVVEMAVEDEITVGDVTVTAVPADHHPGRPLSRVKAPPLGFVLRHGQQVVYYPGDTDLHPVMADLPSPDLALLPIWGWGPSLGTGHLNPRRAAEAAAVLRAKAVLPVHWGTFAPVGLRRRPPAWLHRAAGAFTAMMDDMAPRTHLDLVRPGLEVRLFDTPAR